MWSDQNLNVGMWNKVTMVFSECVWKRHQETLARGRYHMDSWTRSTFERGSHHVLRLPTVSLIPLSSYQSAVIWLWTAHVICLPVFFVCLLPLHTHLEQSIGESCLKSLASQDISRLLRKQKFITVFTGAHYWTLSWASSIQFTPSLYF
jgi:hypothetical protein